MKFTHAFALAGVSLFALSQPAFAQDAQTAEEETESKEDIVVTGTLIRGSAPVGASTIGIDQKDLEETGALSSNELLASIPQVTNNFNGLPISNLSIAVNQIQIARPSLRNIGNNSQSSSPTLILVDGNRIASAGVNQASIDPDLIPTGAIERVEVVTEGGSATYGADAVAGVINFITRKKFDGVKLGGHYGFAKNYWQYDANATVGKAWDNGSIYASYNFAKSDQLLGKERDYVRNLNYSAIPFTGNDITCSAPNLSVNTVLTAFGATIASTNYAAPTFAANTTNRCDNGEEGSFIPKAERHGVLGGLNWNFGDSTELDVRAFWGQRKTASSNILNGPVVVGPANPFVAGSLPAGLSLGVQPFTIFGSPVVNQAVVNFNTLSIGLKGSDDTNISEWGVRAELKQDIGDNWQLRALANWSQSNSRYQLIRFNGTRLNAAGQASTAATAFNPFNLSANNPALLADLIDNAIAGQAKDGLLQLRALIEGKLFSLPGGDVRVALGTEYMRDTLDRRFQTDIRPSAFGALPFDVYKRNIKSVYGELVAPIFARGDGAPMLTLSGSGRYDKYSDFGNTFNPKLGATFEPIKGMRFRGNWGTSFTAPTPVDQLGSRTSFIANFPFVPFQPTPAPTLLPGANNTIAIQGSNPNLGPQEADTWSMGVDLIPTSGLKVSASYYGVDFTNVLGTPTPSGEIFVNFPDNVALNVNGFSVAQVNSFFTKNGTVPLSPALQTQLTNALAATGGGRITELVDFRIGNFGILKLRGVDMSIAFNKEVGGGNLDLNVNANFPMSRKQQVSPVSAIVDAQRFDQPELYLKAGAGFGVGGFYASATVNHTDGYSISPTAGPAIQTEVGSFTTTDLFFKYDLPTSGIMKDLSFTLNIDNVFNKEPPELRRNNPNDRGFANGFTLGRLIQFGVSKKF